MAVFCVLQQQTHDYTTLNRFGETHVLFPLGLNMTNTRIIADSAYAWFEDFDFVNDYYLPTGNPIVVAIVSMVLQQVADEKQESEVTILEWNKHEQKFVGKSFILEGE